MEARVATASDIPAMAETLAGAFYDDPVWGWAFPDPAQRRAQHLAMWTLALEGALDYQWIWTTAACEAVAVWIPPGCPEFADAQAERLPPLIHELVGARAELVFEIFDRFEAAHPHDEPHFYLSLLGTHPDHRGHGYGMDLLRTSLALVDEQHMPAYLESSNPANESRYESVGFVARGIFTLPDGPSLTTMWRP